MRKPAAFSTDGISEYLAPEENAYPRLMLACGISSCHRAGPTGCTDRLLAALDHIVRVVETGAGMLSGLRQIARRAAEEGDWPEDNHVDRVAEYSRELAITLGLSRTQVEDVAQSARMHDVGKVMVPERILQKQGPLTRAEFGLVRLHTVCGAGMLGLRPDMGTARQIALHHHEKWDGTGYPFGLRGDEIPLPARIVAVADVYDALRTHRPYKLPVDHKRALHLILTGDGRTEPGHFCPDVLEAFVASHQRFAEIYEWSAQPTGS